MDRVEYLYIKTEKAMGLWNKCVINRTEWNRDRFVDAVHDIMLILRAHAEETGNTPVVLRCEAKAQYVAHNAMFDLNAFSDVWTRDAFRAVIGIVKHLQKGDA